MISSLLTEQGLSAHPPQARAERCSRVKKFRVQVAADHETTTAARKEELAVIAQARKILEDTSSGAVSQTYSLLQITTRSELAGTEVVTAVKRLAKKYHSAAFAQLASRISSVLRFGSSSGDPFGKVKGLIQDLPVCITILGS